jgi:hypothetical protein
MPASAPPQSHPRPQYRAARRRSRMAATWSAVRGGAGASPRGCIGLDSPPGIEAFRMAGVASR